MPVLRRKLQRIDNAGANTLRGKARDSHAFRDAVRGLESDARDVLGHLIGILLENSSHPLSVLLVNLHGKRSGDIILLKIHHGLAHSLFLFELGMNVAGHAIADSSDFGQSFRFPFDNPERIVSEFPDDSGRHRLADSLDGARAEITLHRKPVLRHADFIRCNLQLLSVQNVDGHAALHLHILSLADGREIADARQLVVPARLGKLENGIAVILIPEFNMLNITFSLFHGPLL